MLFFTLENNQKIGHENETAEKHYRQLLSYCRYHLNFDRTVAEECTQEVYAAYYECLRKIKINDPKAWLFRTADNYLNRYIRELEKEKRKVIPFANNSDDEDEDNRFSYEPEFDSFLNKDIDIEKYADKILTALKDDEKKLYDQYFKDDMPAKDLAVNYNVSMTSMWAKIHRLRQRILKMSIKLLESEQPGPK